MDAIGKLIVGTAQRDAIHVAIAPVVAAMTLSPGTRVGFMDDGNENVGLRPDREIGIIDPFLTEPVKRGQRCWLFLYPNTVTSLRHDWTHPAFTSGPQKADSEQWLRQYAVKMNTYDDPDEAYQRLLNGLRDREIYAYGTDLQGLHDLDDAEELRQHAETVMGIRINWDDYSFKCGC